MSEPISDSRQRKIDLQGGRKLYRWFDCDENEWACAVYDHGPFCRLCQPVDETTHILLGLVESGDCDLKTEANGEFKLKLTPKGTRKAMKMLRDLAEGENIEWDGA